MRKYLISGVLTALTVSVYGLALVNATPQLAEAGRESVDKSAVVLLETRLTQTQDKLRKANTQLRWYRHKVHALNGKIVDLTKPEPAPVPSSPSPSSSDTSYSTSSSGPLRISEAEAAAAMRAAGFPESEIAWFNSGIIARESGYCPTAVYPGHCGDVSLMVAGGPACSLFQLYTCPGPQVADPYVAARYAYAKWKSQGRSAWGG